MIKSDDYFNNLKESINSLDYNLIQKSIDTIYNAYLNNRLMIVMGNGGSASTASHFVCDLAKGTVVNNRKRLKAISLSDNLSLITALGNDIGYDKIFEEQMKNLLTEEDVVIAISCSGNSTNIINGVNYAVDKEAYVIGLTGFDGGEVGKKSNLNIHVNNYNYGQVECVHLMVCHYISNCIYEKIKYADIL